MSYPDLELKVEKLRSDVCKIKERLYKLEDVRDEKEQVSADPSDLDSNKDYALDWYINQYQNMCKEYSKVKIELDGKQSTLEMYIDQNHKFFDQIKELEKELADKQKVLEMVMEQRDRYGKVNYDLEKSNQILRGKIKNHEDRIFDLEEEIRYNKAFGGSTKIKELEKENKRLEEDLRGAHEKVKELDKPYAPNFSDYIDALASIGKKCKEIDDLNKRLDFFEKKTYDLEMEKKDAKWYKEQAIEECYFIVNKIKNDPLTTGEGKRWIVATCQDIQRAIENKFETVWKLSNE